MPQQIHSTLVGTEKVLLGTVLEKQIELVSASSGCSLSRYSETSSNYGVSRINSCRETKIVGARDPSMIFLQGYILLVYCTSNARVRSDV